MIVVVSFLAMSVAVVFVPVVVRLVVFLLGHPEPHGSVADNAPEFADALQSTATRVLCLVRQ